MLLSNDQKFAILKDAYIEQRKEVNFWRERSWKVTTWTIGVLLGILVAKIKLSDHQLLYLLLPLTALAVVVTIYLHKNYKVYVERWQRLADVEEALGFFRIGGFMPGKSLFLQHLPLPEVTYKGTFFFITAIWIMTISVVIAVISNKYVFLYF